MLMAASLLLLPVALTTSPDPTTPPSYHQVRAYVTGYNTVPAQTDATPCVGASGADICGRHDAVACPRRIGLGTVVEIRGTTYVCEDRLARKFDTRFDISCDKDTACPPTVTGWATIKVYAGESASADSGTAAHAAGQAGGKHASRHARATASLWPAMAHTPSSMPAILASAPPGRAVRFLRHASNGRSRASAISHG